MKYLKIFFQRPVYMLIFIGISSFLVLGVALTAQYGFGLHPCKLCIWQRVPYLAVGVLAGLGAWRGWRFVLPLCALLLLGEAGLAAYHAGVEAGWIAGAGSCTQAVDASLTLEQMRAQIAGAPLVPCDQPMARFLGLSMAAWNALTAFGLSAAAAMGWRIEHKRRSL